MLPGAVYLETSFLRGLPFTLQEAIFLNLRELCSEHGITMYTTKLCVDELIEFRREELRKWMATVEDPPPWVRDCLGDPVEVKWARPKEALLVEVEGAVLSALTSQGIEIIDNAQIPQDRLLEMAVKKVPPFKDKGRGYKDAVILLTMIEHERTRIGRSVCLIVAADQDFQGAPKLPDARGLDVTVASSVEHAIRLLQARLADSVKARLREREERLKAFLDTHRDEIVDFVQRHAPTSRNIPDDRRGIGNLRSSGDDRRRFHRVGEDRKRLCRVSSS